MCVCIFECVGMTDHGPPSHLTPSTPAAHIGGKFNTPTCLGRGSDTALFPYNGVQTEGVKGRRGRGGWSPNKKKSERSRFASPRSLRLDGGSWKKRTEGGGKGRQEVVALRQQDVQLLQNMRIDRAKYFN